MDEWFFGGSPHRLGVGMVLATALGVTLATGCAQETYYESEWSTPTCGENSLYSVATGFCECLVGYDWCSDDPDDLSCCWPGEGGGGGGGGGGGACGDLTGVGACRGNTLEYCEDGEVVTETCQAPATCGFYGRGGFYDCIDGDAVEPPSTDDDCAGAPADGWCADSTTIAYCITPSGGGAAEILEVTCGADQTCVEDASGASCALRAGVECDTGAAQCAGDAAVDVCEDGAWTRYACDGSCIDTALGAGCSAVANTTTVLGRIEYEGRDPNETWTDWGAPAIEPAEGLLIVSFRGDDVVDATYTGTGSTAGEFSIQVPQPQTADDGLAAFAVVVDDAGEVAIAVAYPDLGRGRFDPGVLGSSPGNWAWGVEYTLTSERQVWQIAEANGSGAVRVFERALEAYALASLIDGSRVPDPVVIWIEPGTEWSCGACFAPFPTTVPNSFPTQLWLAGSSDAGWWSDAVTAHEMGHWTMHAYGTSPNEGGQHVIGIATHPGLAWSEGWATFYSSLSRGSAAYYDKQNGGFFWVDLIDRVYGNGTPWVRPRAAAGLMQMIDENEVSAMLVELLNNGVAGESLLATLAVPRMTEAPFERGYRTRSWDGLNSAYEPVPYESTRYSAPFFADYLDALRCDAGVSAAAIDAVTDPNTHYPYPSASPLCR